MAAPDPATIGRRFTEQLKAIRADKTLSADGKRLKIAREYSAARKAFDAADTAAREKAAADVDRASRDLFGTAGIPGDPATVAVSQRDALDRADALKSVESAAALMSRALATADEILARAVLRIAWERTSLATPAWAAVVEQYRAARPARDRQVTALVEAQNAADTSPADRMMLKAQLGLPAELAGVGDVDVWLVRQGFPPAPPPLESSDYLLR